MEFDEATCDWCCCRFEGLRARCRSRQPRLLPMPLSATPLSSHTREGASEHACVCTSVYIGRCLPHLHVIKVLLDQRQVLHTNLLLELLDLEAAWLKEASAICGASGWHRGQAGSAGFVPGSLRCPVQ